MESYKFVIFSDTIEQLESGKFSINLNLNINVSLTWRSQLFPFYQTCKYMNVTGKKKPEMGVVWSSTWLDLRGKKRKKKIFLRLEEISGRLMKRTGGELATALYYRRYWKERLLILSLHCVRAMWLQRFALVFILLICKSERKGRQRENFDLLVHTSNGHKGVHWLLPETQELGVSFVFPMWMAESEEVTCHWLP